MSLKVGVSGVRGIIGEALTDEVIGNFCRAYGAFAKAFYCKNKSGAPQIILGRDTRQSGQALGEKAASTLLEAGCGVIDLGICPTPTVLFAVRRLKADGAVIVTASHNPAQWNGLKFARPDGTFLTKEEAGELIRLYENKAFKPAPSGHCHCEPPKGAKQSHPRVTQNNSILNAHLDEVLKHVDVRLIKKANFKVAMDYCNGTGAVSTGYLLKKLNCRIAAINASPDGKFAHNPEPAAKNLTQLCDFVKKDRADVGFAQDPDADRLAIVSERGECIGEENTLALAVRHVLSRDEGRGTRGEGRGTKDEGRGARGEGRGAKDEGRRTKDEGRKKIVVNLSTSRMIDDIAAEFGAEVLRTAVGETNVVSKMRQVGAVIGGEGNGGVIYPSVNFGRDSFVGIALILEYMAKSGKRPSELLAGVRQYKLEKVKIECPREKIISALGRVAEKFKGEKIDTTDGIRIDRKESWVHIRPSNTEPVVRVIAEAATQAEAKKAAEEIKALLIQTK